VSKIKSTFVVILVLAGGALGAITLTAAASGAAKSHKTAAALEKAVASTVTAAQANAMQAKVVSVGEANAVLANPYIEQKVTTPESTGLNKTAIPAGGF
jgi:hypothetical protein